MKSTKRTPSLQSPPKIYPLNQSPLFKLKNKR
ncbi:RNA-directed DNA polymerase, partial [Salmonella enterica]|nr:RNA-directed DNA polymerase [Salmonella enterica]